MSGHSRLMSIVTAPVVSEKSTESADKRRTVVFRVLPDARKDEIKRAVEKMFEVKVEKVRVNLCAWQSGFSYGAHRRARFLEKGVCSLGARQRYKLCGIAIMSVAAIKPTSPGRRGMVLVKQDNLYKGSTYKPLLEPKKQSAGRNNHGRITSWHRGGGHKRHYRVVDFFGTKTACRRKWSVWNMTPTVALIWLCSFMRTESADISLRPRD